MYLGKKKLKWIYSSLDVHVQVFYTADTVDNVHKAYIVPRKQTVNHSMFLLCLA